MSLRHIALAAALLPAALHASGPRPISDLEFQSPVPLFRVAAATDGTDFMVVATGVGTPETIWAQRIIRDGRTTPLTAVGDGTPSDVVTRPDVVWSGAKYVAAWQESGADRILVDTISRDGTAISRPVEVLKTEPFRSPRVVTNGKTVIVAVARDGYVDVRLLDRDGNLLSPPRSILAPETGFFVWDVAAAGDGYVIGFIGRTGAFAAFLDSNATVVSGGATMVDGPYTVDPTRAIAAGVAVASDGTDVMMAFSMGGSKGAFGGPSEVKNVVFDKSGKLKRTVQHVITADRGGWVTGAVWDGSSYVAEVAAYTTSDYYTSPKLLRIDRGGNMVGRAVDLPVGANGLSENLSAVVPAGGDLFAVWTDAQYRTVASFLAKDFALSDARIRLGRTVPYQDDVRVATRRGATLATWISYDDVDSETLRVSRIDGDGNYLDGAGIVVARNHSSLGLQVDRAGDQWVIVWDDLQQNCILATRLSLDGHLIDAQPVRLAEGTSPSIHCEGDRCLLVRANNGLRTATFAPGGTVTDADLLFRSEDLIGYEYLVSGKIAAANGELLVSFMVTDRAGLPEYSQRAAVMRVDAAGHRKDAQPFFVSGYSWIESVASDGHQYLVLWTGTNRYGDVGVWGNVFTAGVPPSGLPTFLAEYASAPSAAFDGKRFLVAWQAYHAIALAPLSPFGLFPVTTLPLDPNELPYDPVLAADAQTAPIVAFSHSGEEKVPRGGLLRLGDIAPNVVAPAPPTGVRAAREGAKISVRWQPVSGSLGISIELRLLNGSYRAIAVAPGGAASATISAEGFDATAVRLRAWNLAGTSEPSADALLSGGDGRGRAVHH